MLQLFPAACVFHLGLYRDRSSFTPTEYYSKLPGEFKKYCDIVYLLDPVVATGGTAVAAVHMLLGAVEFRASRLRSTNIEFRRRHTYHFDQIAMYHGEHAWSTACTA